MKISLENERFFVDHSNGDDRVTVTIAACKFLESGDEISNVSQD